MSRRTAALASCMLLLCLLPRYALATLDAQTLGDPIASGRGATGAGVVSAGLESFKADLFTGAATYAIPIAVPPGTAGVEPRVQLAYRSSSGNGWAGYGWSVGVPAISRSARKGAPRYVDDITDPRHDRFVLADDPLIEISTVDHATELESYARIRRVNRGAADEYWEVTRRDGRMLIFGDTPGTRIEKSPGKIHTWLLRSETDTHGNGIAYAYDTATDPGTAYLSRITYTSHTGEPWMNARAVDFELEAAPRPDPIVSCQAGFPQRITRRLGRIVVTLGGALVRRYELAYATSASGKSLLRSVRMVGRDGQTAAPAQTFAYQDLVPGFDPPATWANPSAGDGYVAIRPARPVGHSEYALLDLTGDGLPDRVTRDKLNDSRWRVYPAVGDGFAAAPILWTNPSGGEVQANRAIRRLSPSGDVLADVIDLDGDGLFDRVTVGLNGDKLNLRFFRNTGGGFAPAVNWPDPADLGQVRKVALTANGFRVTADLLDMNGDGRPDRVKAGGPTWLVYENTGAGFAAAPSTWIVPGAQPNHIVLDENGTKTDVFDLNGDGLADRVTAVNPNASAWSVHFGTGAGFDAVASSWPNPSWNVPEGDGTKIRDTDGSGNLRVTVLDMNGDGLPDRVVSNRTEGTFSVWPNTGSAFAAPAWTWPNPSSAENHALIVDVERPDSLITVADVLDVNGDWLPDRVTVKDDKTPWRVYLSNASAGPDVAIKPELLTRVENGLGGSLTLGYASSASFRDASGGLANPALPSPVIVLAWSALDDGRGTRSETRFHYAGGRYDAPSREFRGFARVTATGPEAPGPEGGVRLVSETDFLQDDQRKGLVAETRLSRSAGGTLSLLTRETTTYHPDASPPYERLVADTRTLTYDGSAEPRLKKVVHASYQDGAPAEIQDLGEVLDEANPLHDGTNDELITRVEYADAGAAHALGLPSHVTVTTGDPGAKQAERWLRYDGLPPGQASRGDRTRVEAWLHDPMDGFTAIVATASAYDAFGNAVTTTDANGHVTTTVFEAAYHTFPIGTILPPLAPGAPGFVTSRTFDAAFGRPITSTDLNGHTGRAELDALGRETATYLAPAGATEILLTRTAYNDALLGAPDDGGAGSPAAQHVTQTRYVRAGSGEAIVSQAFFDGLGRVYRREAPGDQGRAVVTTLAFDATGGVAASTAPGFAGDAPVVTAWMRDVLGRPVRAVNPDGTTLATLHDRWSRREELLSPAGQSLRLKTTRRDAAGRIVQVEEWNATDPGGNPGPYVTSYGYDPRGNLSLVVGPFGHVSVFEHDTLNRKVAMTDPDTGSWRYAYDHAGNLARQVDGRGIALTLDYDALDRLVARRSSEGASTFTYDSIGGVPIPGGIGRLVRATAQSISVDLIYDAFGNVAETRYVNAGFAHRMRREHDLLGRETAATYPDGETVARAYEGAVLKAITSPSAPGGFYLRGASYDAAGRPRGLLLGNGATLDYQYDAATTRLQAIAGASPAAGAVLDLAYTFAPDGGIAAIADGIEPSRSETFVHDALGRLVSAQGAYGAQAYRYDPIGNLIQKGPLALAYEGGPGATGGPHAVKAAGGQTFAYDAGGNMIRMGSKALDYDAEGRLVAVREGAATLAGFHYDAFGRRWKHDGGASPQQWSFGDDFDWDGRYGTKTIRAGGRVIALRTAPYHGEYGSGCALTASPGGSGAGGLGDLAVYALLLGTVAMLRVGSRLAHPTRALARAGGVAFLIAAHLHAAAPRVSALPVHADGSVHAGTLFPMQNHLGSTSVLLDETGAIVRRIHYDPWGAITSSTGSVDVEWGFTGQRLDPEIGLYHYGSRPYHPGLGRFVQPDPAVPDPTSSQGLNRYAYVYNDPQGYTDPGGSFPFIPIIIGAILGGIAAHQQDGNVFLGALFGGLSAGFGAGVSGILGAGMAGSLAGGTAGGFVGGGLQAELAGGGFVDGALSGALGGLIGGAIPTVSGWNIDGFGLEDFLNPVHRLLATVSNAAFRGAFGGAGLARRGLDALTFGGFSKAYLGFEEVWNFPNNLAGDWYARQLGATPGPTHDGIRTYMTDRLGRGVNAAVIGRRMFLRPTGVSAEVFEHEMGHVMQNNLLGPLVFPAFIGSELVGSALGLATALSHGRSGFSDNFFYGSYAYSWHEQILINRGSWFPTMLVN